LLVLFFLNALAEPVHALGFFGVMWASVFFIEANSLPTKTRCSHCFRRGEPFQPPIPESRLA
jgi:hypothetical protein